MQKAIPMARAKNNHQRHTSACAVREMRYYRGVVHDRSSIGDYTTKSRRRGIQVARGFEAQPQACQACRDPSSQFPTSSRLPHGGTYQLSLHTPWVWACPKQSPNNMFKPSAWTRLFGKRKGTAGDLRERGLAPGCQTNMASRFACSCLVSRAVD
jgi:hypothetical protein